MSIEGFRDITFVNEFDAHRLERCVAAVERAMKLLPKLKHTGDALTINATDAVESAGRNLRSAHAVLQHLRERLPE